MIASGTMDERVGIQKPTMTRGASGSQVITFASLGYRWASVKYLKGARALAGGELYMASNISVAMRSMAELTDDCRLVWNDKTYRITSLNRSRSEGTVSILAEVIDINND